MEEKLYEICEEVLENEKESKKFLSYETLNELYEYFLNKLPELTKDEFDGFICEALDSYAKEQENVGKLDEDDLENVSGGAFNLRTKIASGALALMSMFPAVGAANVNKSGARVGSSQSISKVAMVKAKISDAFQKTKAWIKAHPKLSAGIGIGAAALAGVAIAFKVKNSREKANKSADEQVSPTIGAATIEADRKKIEKEAKNNDENKTQNIINKLVSVRRSAIAGGTDEQEMRENEKIAFDKAEEAYKKVKPIYDDLSKIYEKYGVENDKNTLGGYLTEAKKYTDEMVKIKEDLEKVDLIKWGADEDDRSLTYDGYNPDDDSDNALHYYTCINNMVMRAKNYVSNIDTRINDLKKAEEAKIKKEAKERERQDAMAALDEFLNDWGEKHPYKKDENRTSDMLRDIAKIILSDPKMEYIVYRDDHTKGEAIEFKLAKKGHFEVIVKPKDEFGKKAQRKDDFNDLQKELKKMVAEGKIKSEFFKSTKSS